MHALSCINKKMFELISTVSLNQGTNARKDGCHSLSWNTFSQK